MSNSSLTPNRIVEWIPFNNLDQVTYFTKGGCSEIYKTIWVDGYYNEWDAKEKRLIRAGTHEVILKALKNVESANISWFDEVLYYRMTLLYFYIQYVYKNTVFINNNFFHL